MYVRRSARVKMKKSTSCCLLIAALTYISADGHTTHSSCPTIVTKQRWGGISAIKVPYQIVPVPNVIIHHTVTQACTTKLACATIITNIQSYHINDLKYDDIGYNFLIGNDGRVYEGAGWHVEGAHTFGYNKKSIGIAFIGDFSEELPSASAIDAVKNLLKCGVEKGELDKNYRLYGGKQIISTESPGLELYGEIQDWDHWSSSTL